MLESVNMRSIKLCKSIFKEQRESFARISKGPFSFNKTWKTPGLNSEDFRETEINAFNVIFND
jgi:hypothetical protein